MILPEMPYKEILNELLINTTLESPEPRSHWIPLMDLTGLILAVAWKHNEHTAWQLFGDDCQGHC